MEEDGEAEREREILSERDPERDDNGWSGQQYADPDYGDDG